MRIYEIVNRVAKYYGYSSENINRVSTKDLRQKAIRPLKTGFILEKARRILGYRPRSFEEALSLIE